MEEVVGAVKLSVASTSKSHLQTHHVSSGVSAASQCGFPLPSSCIVYSIGAVSCIT